MPELRVLRSIANSDAAWRAHGVIFWDNFLAVRGGNLSRELVLIEPGLPWKYGEGCTVTQPVLSMSLPALSWCRPTTLRLVELKRQYREDRSLGRRHSEPS
jgi:hypothetical protein